MAAVTEAARAEHLAPPSTPQPGRRRLGGEQLTVAAGQFAAGAGNLAFALVAARVLDPSAFARLSVFLGLYLILSLPTTSLTAATAVQPDRRSALVRRVALASLVFAGLTVATSPFTAGPLNLPVGLVIVLALSVPVMAPLARERGRLYGRYRHGRLISSLLAEPAVRLTVGVGFAAAFGEVGAATGVVVGAYAAREVARARRLHVVPPTPAVDGSRGAGKLVTGGEVRNGERSPAIGSAEAVSTAGWTAAAFALLAVLQCQDLVFANAILPGREAGGYAALSTLGGAAAFATVTIPLVLLPRAVRGDRHSLAVAVGLASALGAATVAVGAIAPRLMAAGLFGARYGSVSRFVVPYLAAMAMLGVARVLVAHRCATGAPRAATVLVGVVAVGQAISIAAVGRTVGSIAATTVGATAVLTAGLGAERLVRSFAPGRELWLRPGASLHDSLRYVGRKAWGGLVSWVRKVALDPTVRAVAALCAAGLVVRFVVMRGIWLDEATSIHQAGMSFGGMLQDLRTTDVHPPLYFVVLWVTDRVFGTGELAMRLPSIVAGTLIIPAAYVAGRDLWDRRTGLIAATLSTIAPIVVWYSQEVRMYSMFMLFAVLAVWGQARVMRRGAVTDWTVYVLASAAVVWTEYFGIFQVVAQQLVFVGVLWTRRRERSVLIGRLVPFVVATMALLAFLAPLLPFASHQFLVNQSAGKGFGGPSQVGLSGAQSMSVYTVLANFAWAVVGYHSAAIMAALVALWPLGILLTLFLLGRKITDSTVAVLAAVLVPALLLLGVGLFKRNLFDVRYMSGVVVALLLLGARGITGGTRSVRLQAAACAAVAMVFFVSLGDEQINGSNPRLYDFAGALHAVDHRARPGDVVLYDPGDINLVVTYYAPHVKSAPLGAPGSTLRPGQQVFLLDCPRLMHPGEPAALGRALVTMRRVDSLTGVIRKANVTVWVFRVGPAGPAAAPATPPAPGPPAPGPPAPNNGGRP